MHVVKENTNEPNEPQGPMAEAAPKKGPTFNPQLAYQWESNQDLIIKGAELHFLKQTTEAALRNIPEAPLVLSLAENLKVLNEMIARGVEMSLITEAPPQEGEPDLSPRK